LFIFNLSFTILRNSKYIQFHGKSILHLQLIEIINSTILIIGTIRFRFVMEKLWTEFRSNSIKRSNNHSGSNSNTR